MPKFSHIFHIDTVFADCIDCHPKAIISEQIEDKIFPVRRQCDPCHFEEVHLPPTGIGICNMRGYLIFGLIINIYICDIVGRIAGRDGIYYTGY